ncbi:hypothetical protein ACGFH8_00970 [Micromonospora sp. NPDC049175]|uniref:hypothetical protein n=1 Tax=Micromonospora sp. NPDC049175 TaxID=3364266 RepID=UPI00371D7754
MRAGDVICLTTAASVRFLRPITVRAIRELPDRHTYDGWLWIDGYELSAAGDAVARRELFVMRDGVRWEAHPSAPRKPRSAHRQVIRRGSVRVG